MNSAAQNWNPSSASSYYPVASTSHIPYDSFSTTTAQYGGQQSGRIGYQQQQQQGYGQQGGPSSASIRRARSSGALALSSSSSSGYAYSAYSAPAMPPSPVSPTYRDAPYAVDQQYSQANQPPQTPSPRKRVASDYSDSPWTPPTSAPLATYASVPATVPIPEYAAPPMSYSYTTPTSAKPFQQPTAEEVSEVRRIELSLGAIATDMPSCSSSAT